MKVLQSTSVSRLGSIFLALVLSFIFSGNASAAAIEPSIPWLAQPFAFECPGASCPTLVASLTTGSVNSSNGNLTFTMNAAVYSDPGNTYCAGCFDFVYQIGNSSSSHDVIGRVTATDFTGWMTNVGFVANGSSLGHSFVDGLEMPQLVDPPLGVPAATVGFTFNLPGSMPAMPVTPGTTSLVMIVQTNARNFEPGNVNVIDSDGSTTVDGFQPAAGAKSLRDAPTAPEPASFVLLGMGLFVLAGISQSRIAPAKAGRDRTDRPE
jgi:hypothetical protein